MSKSRSISFLKRIKIQSEPLVPLVKALEEEIGQEQARAIVRRALRGWTREFYENIRRGFNGNPIDLIAGGMPTFAERGALDYEILNQTEDSFDFNVTRCAYAEFYKDLGEPDLGFLIVCDLDFAMAEGLGPDIEFERSQTIMQGASRCEFRYRRKYRT